MIEWDEKAARERLKKSEALMGLQVYRDLQSALAEIDRLRSITTCYCVCHSGYSSRTSCEHCADHEYFHIKTQLAERDKLLRTLLESVAIDARGANRLDGKTLKQVASEIEAQMKGEAK